MIVSLAEIKEWVRANDDDAATVEQLIDEAEEELKVTGREFSDTDKLAVQFCKFYVTYWFDNRYGTNYETYSRIKSSMLTKLTYTGDETV
jgi:hypothetical protein